MRYTKINDGRNKYELTGTEYYDLERDIIQYLLVPGKQLCGEKIKIFRFTVPVTGKIRSRIFIETGWRWNGANIVPDYESTMRATCLHDALYYLIEEGILTDQARKLADLYLYRHLREAGFPIWRAGTWYLGVRFFGWACV